MIWDSPIPRSQVETGVSDWDQVQKKASRIHNNTTAVNMSVVGTPHLSPHLVLGLGWALRESLIPGEARGRPAPGMGTGEHEPATINCRKLFRSHQCGVAPGVDQQLLVHYDQPASYPVPTVNFFARCKKTGIQKKLAVKTQLL